MKIRLVNAEKNSSTPMIEISKTSTLKHIAKKLISKNLDMRNTVLVFSANGGILPYDVQLSELVDEDAEIYFSIIFPFNLRYNDHISSYEVSASATVGEFLEQISFVNDKKLKLVFNNKSLPPYDLLRNSFPIYETVDLIIKDKPKVTKLSDKECISPIIHPNYETTSKFRNKLPINSHNCSVQKI